jgi:hypothetical protein
MKRKKGNDSLTTKKRWMILTAEELFYYRDGSLTYLCGSLALVGARVALQDPVLTLELGDGVVYLFTSDFESPNQPSVLRWHDALRAALLKRPGRASGKASPPTKASDALSGVSSFKSFKKLLHK